MRLTEYRLKYIYRRLQKGRVFYGVRYNGTIDKHAYIYRTWNDVEHTEYCLVWQNYGSSANANTLEGLRFICEKILDNHATLTEGRWLRPAKAH